MSDIGMDVPLPVALLFIGVYYWPVTCSLGLMALVGAFLLRGIGRFVCSVAALLFIVDLVFALYLARN